MTSTMGGRAILSLLLLLLPLLPPAGAGEPETVRLGICFSLSGDFAGFGNTYLAGMKIRIDDHNARAAEHGYRIEAVVRDDKSDPELSRTIARELIHEEKVAAIIGSSATSVTLAMLPEVEANGVALISPAATNPAIGSGGNNSFRVLFDDDFQGEVLARHLIERLGLRRAAIVTNARFDRYGEAIRRSFLRHFTEAGGRMVWEETYNAQLPDIDLYDFRPLLERVKQANPEAVLLPGYSAEGAAIVRQSLAVGLSPVFCGGDAWHKDSLLYEAGNNIDGACYVGVMDESADTPEMREFMRLLDQSHDHDAEPASALGYDAIALFIEAAKNGTSREAILEGLYGIRDFPLVTGRITIDREKGTGKTAYVLEISRDGNDFSRRVVEVVEP